MIHAAKRIGLIGSALSMAFPVASHAQTLQIAPITIDLPAGRMASTLRVTNRGDEPTTIQIRPFAWHQIASSETLDPTTDLLTSPPFATLGPGESQIVRVVLRKAAVDHEQTYRLLIDQLPPAAAPGSVRVALRVSLPVFAGVAGGTRPLLTWILTAKSTDSASLLSVNNPGLRRARIWNLKLTAPGATLAPVDFNFKYVLAGSSLVLPIDLHGSRPAVVHVTADSDQGRIEADAPVTIVP